MAYIHFKELVENGIKNNRNMKGLYIKPVEYIKIREKTISRTRSKMKGIFISVKTRWSISNKDAENI